MNYSKIKQAYVDTVIFFPLIKDYKYIPYYCNTLIRMLPFSIEKIPKTYANDSNYV